jgi:hypothetical protein
MRHIAVVWGVILMGCVDEGMEQIQREVTSPNCFETDTVDIQSFEISPGDSAWDNDCDGYPAGRPNGSAFVKDCDDNDDTVHPDALEFNNGIDANCDGDLQPLYGCGQTGYALVMLPPWLLTLGAGRRRRRRGAGASS